MATAGAGVTLLICLDIVDIHAVVAAIAVQDAGFAGVRQDFEFVAQLFGKGAARRFRHFGSQPHLLEDAFVRIFGNLVKAVKVRLTRVEAVHIFHQEFAPAQDARFGAELIAEFPVDMVDRKRQVFGTVDPLFGQRRHRLLITLR